MTRQIVVCSPNLRREPLLEKPPPIPCCRRTQLAEVAGGTTAECAAVCCCCPCGLANFLVLFLYKLPKGLCHRAMKKRRLRRLLKKGLMAPQCSGDESELQIQPVLDALHEKKSGHKLKESEKEDMELEKEMWNRFYNSGFWRSTSETDSPNRK